MSQAFDPYHKWLGIPKDEQPPNHYRLLAIRIFEDDPDVIQAAADRQMAHLRTYQTGPNAALSQKLLNEVAAARVCLLKVAKKKAYDAQIRKDLPTVSPQPSSPPSQRTGLDLGDLLDELIVASETQPALKRRSSPVHLPLLIGGGIAAFGLVLALLIWSLVAVDRPAPGLPPTEITPVAQEPPVSAPPSTSPEPHATSPAPLPPAANSAASGEEMADEQANTPPAAMPKDDQPVQPPTMPPADVAALPPESKRLPVPTAARQKELQQRIDETYKTSLTGKLAEKIKLARNLLDAAPKTPEPEERFVLCREAAGLAQAAGDATLMVQAVDQLAGEFDLDGLATKKTMLIAFAGAAESASRIDSLVINAEPLIDQLMSEESYGSAWDLLNAVYLACQKPDGKAFRKAYRERRQQLQTLLDEWKQVEQAKTTLKARPDDVPAQTVLGQWYCFVRHDWRKGLPHLAKGDEATIRPLALEEVQSPPEEAIDQARLADAWWDYAQTTQGETKNAVLLRARYWYLQADDELPDGLMKTRVAGRLKEIDNLVPLAPETPGLQTQGIQTPGLLSLVPSNPEAAKAYQTRWARHLGIPDIEINTLGMKLALIPPGESDMGTRTAEVDRLLLEASATNAPQGYSEFLRSETPRHLVRITKPFYFGLHEVTQAEYQQVMGVNPSQLTAQSESHPVEGVSWDNAVEFCRRLSELPEEKAAGRVYRLPTEAQWEYACRAGRRTAFSFGNDPAGLDQSAWFAGNAKGRTHPVGERRSNPWGLFDMLGNVAEWCGDWFATDYYQQALLENPWGPPSGHGRVIRGGSFRETWPGALRSASRLASPASGRNEAVGFRIACEIPQKRSP